MRFKFGEVGMVYRVFILIEVPRNKRYVGGSVISPYRHIKFTVLLSFQIATATQQRGKQTD